MKDEVITDHGINKIVSDCITIDQVERKNVNEDEQMDIRLLVSNYLSFLVHTVFKSKECI